MVRFRDFQEQRGNIMRENQLQPKYVRNILLHTHVKGETPTLEN